MLFIDTAGTKPAVTKQSLSIANFTIFQMIMEPRNILVNVCIMYMLSQPNTGSFSYMALLHMYCE